MNNSQRRSSQARKMPRTSSAELAAKKTKSAGFTFKKAAKLPPLLKDVKLPSAKDIRNTLNDLWQRVSNFRSGGGAKTPGATPGAASAAHIPSGATPGAAPGAASQAASGAIGQAATTPPLSFGQKMRYVGGLALPPLAGYGVDTGVEYYKQTHPDPDSLLNYYPRYYATTLGAAHSVGRGVAGLGGVIERGSWGQLGRIGTTETGDPIFAKTPWHEGGSLKGTITRQLIVPGMRKVVPITSNAVGIAATPVVGYYNYRRGLDTQSKLDSDALDKGPLAPEGTPYGEAQRAYRKVKGQLSGATGSASQSSGTTVSNSQSSGTTESDSQSTGTKKPPPPAAIPNWAKGLGILGGSLGLGMLAHHAGGEEIDPETGKSRKKTPWLGPLVGAGALGTGAYLLKGDKPWSETLFNPDWWGKAAEYRPRLPMVLVPYRVKLADGPITSVPTPPKPPVTPGSTPPSPPPAPLPPSPSTPKPQVTSGSTPPPPPAPPPPPSPPANSMSGTAPPLVSVPGTSGPPGPSAPVSGQPESRLPGSAGLAGSSRPAGTPGSRGIDPDIAAAAGSMIGLGATPNIGGLAAAQQANRPPLRTVDPNTAAAAASTIGLGATPNIGGLAAAQQATVTNSLARRLYERNPEIGNPTLQLRNIQDQLIRQGYGGPGLWDTVVHIWNNLGLMEKLLVGAGLSLGAIGLLGTLTGNESFGGGTGMLMGLGGLAAAALGSNILDERSPIRQAFSGDLQKEMALARMPFIPEAITPMTPEELNLFTPKLAWYLLDGVNEGNVRARHDLARLAVTPQGREHVLGLLKNDPQSQQQLNDAFERVVPQYMQTHQQLMNRAQAFYGQFANRLGNEAEPPGNQAEPAPGNQAGPAPGNQAEPPGTGAAGTPAPQIKTWAEAENDPRLQPLFERDQKGRPGLSALGQQFILDPKNDQILENIYRSFDPDFRKEFREVFTQKANENLNLPFIGSKIRPRIQQLQQLMDNVDRETAAANAQGNPTNGASGTPGQAGPGGPGQAGRPNVGSGLTGPTQDIVKQLIAAPNFTRQEGEDPTGTFEAHQIAFQQAPLATQADVVRQMEAFANSPAEETGQDLQLAKDTRQRAAERAAHLRDIMVGKQLHDLASPHSAQVLPDILKQSDMRSLATLGNRLRTTLNYEKLRNIYGINNEAVPGLRNTATQITNRLREQMIDAVNSGNATLPQQRRAIAAAYVDYMTDPTISDADRQAFTESLPPQLRDMLQRELVGGINNAQQADVKYLSNPENLSALQEGDKQAENAAVRLLTYGFGRDGIGVDDRWGRFNELTHDLASLFTNKDFNINELPSELQSLRDTLPKLHKDLHEYAQLLRNTGLSPSSPAEILRLARAIRGNIGGNSPVLDRANWQISILGIPHAQRVDDYILKGKKPPQIAPNDPGTYSVPTRHQLFGEQSFSGIRPNGSTVLRTHGIAGFLPQGGVSPEQFQKWQQAFSNGQVPNNDFASLALYLGLRDPNSRWLEGTGTGQTNFMDERLHALDDNTLRAFRQWLDSHPQDLPDNVPNWYSNLHRLNAIDPDFGARLNEALKNEERRRKQQVPNWYSDMHQVLNTVDPRFAAMMQEALRKGEHRSMQQ